MVTQTHERLLQLEVKQMKRVHHSVSYHAVTAPLVPSIVQPRILSDPASWLQSRREPSELWLSLHAQLGSVCPFARRENAAPTVLSVRLVVPCQSSKGDVCLGVCRSEWPAGWPQDIANYQEAWQHHQSAPSMQQSDRQVQHIHIQSAHCSSQQQP